MCQTYLISIHLSLSLFYFRLIFSIYAESTRKKRKKQLNSIPSNSNQKRTQVVVHVLKEEDGDLCLIIIDNILDK